MLDPDWSMFGSGRCQIPRRRQVLEGDKEYQELVRKLNHPGRIPDQVESLVMSLKGLSGDVTSIDIVRHETLLQDDLDGVTFVIFGILVVSQLSYAR
ncbi:hypothetical protein C5167_049240 [Papaver somniferum]|uniref:Uncharacterized protein n=1 Tax=Papaver somniferum TaxID=3469 RepID=A0A4Y7KN04_PAPSO|nr:hypothetical protein C5167_049240 [Papaver somniferum]